MKIVRTNVESLLKDNPELRNSDKKLLIRFWEREGLFLTKAQKQKFLELTPSESITRARRALKTKYPASEEVDDYRYSLFKEYSNDYAYVERDCA